MCKYNLKLFGRYKHDRERNEKRRIDNRKKRGAEEDVSGFEYGKPGLFPSSLVNNVYAQ